MLNYRVRECLYLSILSIGFIFLTLVLVNTIQAATLITLSIKNNIVGATCNTSEWEITYSWRYTTNDSGSGVDYAAMVATDANGVLITVSWDGATSGGLGIASNTQGFGNGIVNDITASPLTITVYDIYTSPSIASDEAAYNDIIAQSAPVLGTLTYDPSSDVPSCPSPSVSSSITSIEDEEDSIPLPAFYDGRINNYDSAAPIAVYPHAVNGEIGLVIYSSEGEFLLVISPEQIANAPADNSLVAEGGGISVYRLAGGSWQVNAPQYNGKTYVIIFPELFHSGGYESFELEG